MRRKSAFSWLTAFRKAFQNSKKKPEVDNEGYKKREKRRWSFQRSRELPPPPPPSPEKMISEVTTAMVFLPREYYAAVIIQTVFRGYLARRALRALKGLVMLQALVRGSNVRRKTDMIVETMKALVRVQNKYSPSRVAAPFNGHRLSFSCTDNFWDSSSMKSREGSMFAGNWRNYHRRLDQIQSNLKREEANSCALSYQNRRSDCNLYHKDEDPPETTWLDQWMASRTSISNRNRGRRLTTDHPFATPSPSIAAGSPRITPSTPNYMAATESAIARLRSRSVERERPPTARKRLSFPGPEAIGGNRVWSPRCRGMGRQTSNASSSVAESFGGEVSPASTADIRRWLR